MTAAYRETPHPGPRPDPPDNQEHQSSSPRAVQKASRSLLADSGRHRLDSSIRQLESSCPGVAVIPRPRHNPPNRELVSETPVKGSEQPNRNRNHHLPARPFFFRRPSLRPRPSSAVPTVHPFVRSRAAKIAGASSKLSGNTLLSPNCVTLEFHCTSVSWGSFAPPHRRRP